MGFCKIFNSLKNTYSGQMVTAKMQSLKIISIWPIFVRGQKVENPNVEHYRKVLTTFWALLGNVTRDKLCRTVTSAKRDYLPWPTHHINS